VGAWSEGHPSVLSRNPEDLGSARDHHLPGLHYGKEGKGTLAVSVQERHTPRDCHLRQVTDLREKISRKDALKSLEVLKAAGSSAIEMSEAKAPAHPAVS
jgi:hypothetical protein